mgnify:CR=1 FL=1
MLIPKRVKYRKQFRGRMKVRLSAAIKSLTAISVW